MNEPNRHGHRVISVDGPAASGKSTTANAVARRLGFVHLNSGLLYRALTWRVVGEGWDEAEPDFPRRIESIRIELRASGNHLQVFVDGEDPGPELHDRAVADRVSAVSGAQVVRQAVLTRLRHAGAQFDLVCDGRDIGTTVFPNADLKIFLVADANERARRRLLEQEVELTDSAVEREAARLIERDRADSSRELSPLRRASDAIEIDTTKLTGDEVVEKIVRVARKLSLGSPRARRDAPRERR